MTERRAPSPLVLAATSLAVFSLVLALLFTRARAGDDPALGHPKARVVVSAPPRRVLIRRMVRRVVITRVREIEPAAPIAGSAAPTSVAAAPSPTVSASPPVVVASAPAPAPAPAPPAPVSRSS